MSTETTSLVMRAIRLADMGFYVFPCGRNKKPIAASVPHGHLDATRDPEALAVWFTENPEAFIGIATGKSGIVVLDIDVRPDRDGFEQIELNFHGVPFGAFEYDTPSGGKHIWMRAPEGLDLPPAVNYRGMPGVDRKSGSSYICYYAPETPDDLSLPAAPQWLLDVKEKRTTGDAFEGEIDEWLNTLEEGEPDSRVLAAIERIPDADFGHDVMVAQQYNLIRLAAEGAIGVRVALDLLRDEWTRPPYDTEDYRLEFDAALETGVKRHGAELDRIRSLPNYLDSLNMLGSTVVTRLMGDAKGKGHYFEMIGQLVGADLSDHRIASIIWHGPTTRAWAREWGIDYLYTQIQRARYKKTAPVENPALSLDANEDKFTDLSLLSVEERIVMADYAPFTDQWMTWANEKVNVLNPPYHRQNCLTVLSMGFGGHVFDPKPERPMEVNLFQLSLGESSTGKSESTGLRGDVFKILFANDEDYDLGSNASPEALQAALIERDKKPSLFHTDEAAAPLTEFITKSYTAGMTDRLTSYYEGHVPPMLRRNDPAMKKSARTSFNIAMFGTPEKVTNIITKDQFESGFMARFLFEIGDPSVEDPNRFIQRQSLERAVNPTDPKAAGFADLIGRKAKWLRQGGHAPRPVLFSTEALDRLTLAAQDLHDAIKFDPDVKMLEPSTRRLNDSLRKITILLAVADGDKHASIRHVLRALEFGENYLRNAVAVARMVNSSIWAKECDAIEAFVRSRQNGSVQATRLYNNFRNTEHRIVVAQLEHLVMQGRLLRHEAVKDRGELYELNRNGSAAEE